MEYPRTPSPPPPPPPTPPEILEPMDLSSERALRQGAECAQDHQDMGHEDRHLHDETAGKDPPRQNHVSSVSLRGIPIVCLFIDGLERLCLAQISNTLLKHFSYNEIHNRRVALGITCVQCTPVQLEILRRAGAMPISSRRCGMITKREAERLVKSFLEEHAPPKLPDNFAFKVVHSCGWGSKGSFIPSRYNSSRAKCIKCTYCNLFFSPNKFIFHYHRMPDAKYRHPDAANFNSWRRHLELDYDLSSDDLMHAWEDVKAMFNGGSRKRLVPSSSGPSHTDMSNKRQRISMDNPSIPKLPPNPNCSVFPPVNGLPNLFPQQPPYGNFPVMHNDVDPMAGDNRRGCMPDIWRPKNAMPYYNPLGIMWAKNFGFCPPATSKPDMMREHSLRMPNMFMDMNGNKPTMDNPGRSKSTGNKAYKSGSRTSAFRPVGNFVPCPSLCPAPEEDFLSLSRPAMSTSSDHSDEFSENLADDEDIDIDVEDAKDEDSDSNSAAFDEQDLNMTLTHELVPKQPDMTTKRDAPITSTSPCMSSPEFPKKSDHVTSFMIDRIFDSKPEISLTKTTPDREKTGSVKTPENTSPSSMTSEAGHTKSASDAVVTVTTSQDITSMESFMNVAAGRLPEVPVTTCSSSTPGCSKGLEAFQDLDYILHLSKEQLQTELLKMLGMKQNQTGHETENQARDKSISSPECPQQGGGGKQANILS